MSRIFTTNVSNLNEDLEGKIAQYSGMSFPERLKTARKAKGLTHEKLAELIGVERTTVTNWERPGSGMPRQKYWSDLARVLHVNENWLTVGAGRRAPGDGSTGDARSDKLDRAILRETMVDILSWSRENGDPLDVQRLADTIERAHDISLDKSERDRRTIRHALFINEITPAQNG